jgi:hypothetical protein
MKPTMLTAHQVIRRMKAGDLPTCLAYSCNALFRDGAKARGKTMGDLVRSGVIRRPAHTSVDSPYTLAVQPLA